jgi:hypothetical protein
MSNGYGIGNQGTAGAPPKEKPPEKPKNVVDLIKERNKKLKEAAEG